MSNPGNNSLPEDPSLWVVLGPGIPGALILIATAIFWFVTRESHFNGYAILGLAFGIDFLVGGLFLRDNPYDVHPPRSPRRIGDPRPRYTVEWIVHRDPQGNITSTEERQREVPGVGY